MAKSGRSSSVRLTAGVMLVLAAIGLQIIVARAHGRVVDPPLPEGRLAVLVAGVPGGRFLLLDDIGPEPGSGEATILLTLNKPISVEGFTYSYMVKRIAVDCDGSAVRDLKGSLFAEDGSYVSFVRYTAEPRPLRAVDVEYDLMCSASGHDRLFGLPTVRGYLEGRQLALAAAK